jgi:chromosome condensin MukBEF MukE localization factor
VARRNVYHECDTAVCSRWLLIPARCVLFFKCLLLLSPKKDENSDGVLTVEELMRWIDEHKLVKFVEEGRDADMDRVMEEVQTPTSPADANNENINSSGKVKDNSPT